MKKNKFFSNVSGFSLIELLAVIIILGLIALITVPIILNQLKESKNDLFEQQIALIEAGAVSYVTDAVAHSDVNSAINSMVKNKTNGIIKISLSDLQNNGSVDYNIMNPLCEGDDKYFSPEDTKIQISYDGKEFSYEVLYQELGQQSATEDGLKTSCTAKRTL